jgi:hypothetical protein
MVSILISVLIMLIVLAVILIIARKILAALGWGEFDGILVAVILLCGLIWFLNIVGLLAMPVGMLK